MTNRILSYLQYGNCFCGIEHTKKDGEEIIHSTILKQSKKELNIESSFEAKTIENTSQNIKKNQHAYLIINNDKVLSKQLDSEQKDPLKLLYQTFPNIQIDDFFYEILSEKNIHFISLCRKDYVIELIETYKKNKVNIVGVSFGNSSISTLKAFFNSNEIYSSNSKILIEEGYIIKINKENTSNEQNYNLNGLLVSNSSLLSLSAALNSVLKKTTTKTNFDLTKQQLLTDYNQIRFFQQFLRFAGLFLLIGLLINFFVFNHYFNEVNDLSQIFEFNQSTKTKIVKLNESVSKKQKTVNDLLKSNRSKSSFYVNAIIQTLPKSILLSDINYQPLNKRIKQGKEIDLNSNIIQVFGTSNESELFSKWISQLEQTNWVEKVNIEAYGASSKSNSDFTVKINISNDQ